MTTLQRQQMKDSMKKGDSLPSISSRRARPPLFDENVFDLKKNYYFLKRGKDKIAMSGAYEREKFRPLERTGIRFFCEQI